MHGLTVDACDVHKKELIIPFCFSSLHICSCIKWKELFICWIHFQARSPRMQITSQKARRIRCEWALERQKSKFLKWCFGKARKSWCYKQNFPMEKENLTHFKMCSMNLVVWSGNRNRVRWICLLWKQSSHLPKEASWASMSLTVPVPAVCSFYFEWLSSRLQASNDFVKIVIAVRKLLWRVKSQCRQRYCFTCRRQQSVAAAS